MTKRAEKIAGMLAPTIEAMGYDLWGIEYLAQGKHSMLRIFIDAEAGITVADCASVSHQVSGILDVEDPIHGEYNLEVSSPGVDRPLFTLAQFGLYVGEQVQLRLYRAVNKKRKFTALIAGVTEDSILLEVAGEPLEVLFEQVEKATLVANFD